MSRLAMPVVTLALMAATAGLLPAQNISIFGSSLGIVTDPSGAAVPNLRVTIKNASTGIANTTTTNAFGAYRVDGLIAGPYQVEADGAGFKKYIQGGITLSSAQTVRADIALQVGDVTQSVEVTAAAPLINTESGQISESILWDTRKYLPTSNPSFFAILGLAPGAVTSSPSFNVSFHGSRTTNYDYSINGSSFRSPAGTTTSIAGRRSSTMSTRRA